MASSVCVDDFVYDEDTGSISDTSQADLDISLSSEDGNNSEHFLDGWEAGIPIENGSLLRKRHLSSLQNHSSETSNVVRRRSNGSSSNTKRSSQSSDYEQNGTHFDGLLFDGRPTDLLFFANGVPDDGITASCDLEEEISISEGRRKALVSVPKDEKLTMKDAIDDMETETTSLTKRKSDEDNERVYLMAKRLRRDHRMFRYEHRYISFSTDLKFGDAKPDVRDEDTAGKRVYLFKEHAGKAHRRPELHSTLDIHQEAETSPSRHPCINRNPITLWDCIWGWVGVILFGLVLVYILTNRTHSDYTERDFSD